jgi:hypothetical protein
LFRQSVDQKLPLDQLVSQLTALGAQCQQKLKAAAPAANIPQLAGASA